MNFPFALWLIGLETGMGTISANKVNGIFSQVLLEKVFLLKKTHNKPSSFAGCGRVLYVISGDVAAIL